MDFEDCNPAFSGVCLVHISYIYFCADTRSRDYYVWLKHTYCPEHFEVLYEKRKLRVEKLPLPVEAA